MIKLVRLGLGRKEESEKLLKSLIGARSKSTAGWGYNFDWQTRSYLVPRFTPNIICTTFAGNALLDGFEAYGDESHLEHAIQAGHFLLNGLNRSGEARAFCFSYTPLDHSQIHNANLLGAAFLARLNSFTPNPAFEEAAIAATRFSLERVRPNGSWPYGEGPKQKWIDSFHTGYNLVALDTIGTHLDVETIEPILQKGHTFFVKNFFTSAGVVRYYHDGIYPIDIHGIAQAIVTLLRLARYDMGSENLARQVFDWAAANMLSEAGWFYFQRKRWCTIRIPYMRWSQAWMLLAMVCLAEVEKRTMSPCQSAQ